MTDFSHAIRDLTFDAVQRASRPSAKHWIRAHLPEITKAVEAGVPWDDIYTLAEPELPQPLSFQAFVCAVMACE
jgi:hypothetical protein